MKSPFACSQLLQALPLSVSLSLSFLSQTRPTSWNTLWNGTKYLKSSKKAGDPKNPSERGQGLVEYLIIVALVAVASMAIMRILGHSITVNFSEIARSLGAESSGPINKARVSEDAHRKKDLRNFMRGSLGGGRTTGGSEEGEETHNGM